MASFSPFADPFRRMCGRPVHDSVDGGAAAPSGTRSSVAPCAISLFVSCFLSSLPGLSHTPAGFCPTIEVNSPRFVSAEVVRRVLEGRHRLFEVFFGLIAGVLFLGGPFV